MRKSVSYVLPVAALAAGASLLSAAPAMAQEAPVAPVAQPEAEVQGAPVEGSVPEPAASTEAPVQSPGAPTEIVEVPAVTEAPTTPAPVIVVEEPAAPAPVVLAAEVPAVDVPAVDVPVSEPNAEAQLAYDLAVREAVAAKWRQEAAERAAAIRAAVAAKWRYEAAIREAVAAKWRYEAAIRAAVAQKMRAEAAFIAAIQANMRARAAAANPFSASEAWASSAKAQSVIRCESGGNYGISTGNGYYGAWQFDYGTWLGNGGGQFAPYAHLATPAQQNYIAYRTWQARGWQPWACA